MTDWPVHGRISGPIVMIGFGSIGKGTLPLIERHFEFDRKRLVMIDPTMTIGNWWTARLRIHQGRRHQGQLPRAAHAAPDPWRRPGVLRQSVGGHLVAGDHGIVPRDRRALHRHRGRALGRFLFRQAPRPGKALQLRPARDGAGVKPQEPGRDDRGFLLRRQSRHGVLVREAGSGRSSPPIMATRRPNRKPARDGRELAHSSAIKGIHIAERDTQRSRIRSR